MKDLTPLEKTLRSQSGRAGRIDIRRFWTALLYCEQNRQQHGLEKYDILQAVRLRFYDNGSVAHTYQELADYYGCAPEYARRIVYRGLRWMRRPNVEPLYR